jgi:lyso-ornithine lipid O-acyltransferase
VEKIQASFRSTVRIIIFAIYLVFFLLASFSIHFFSKDADLRKRRFSRHGQWWCALCCKTFGIKVQVTGMKDPDLIGLVVGNHIGFIDILASASIRNNLFVTSKEMRETPILGLLTEMGGCIYVDRRTRSQIKNELGEIIDALKKGFRVVLYPEATSTNGEGVLPFKRTLITAAAHAGVPILPYVFNFREINGEPGFLLKYRDAVCWYGDIAFYTSIWRAFGLKNLICEIRFLDPVYPAIDTDRAVLADQLHRLIVSHYTPVHT